MLRLLGVAVSTSALLFPRRYSGVVDFLLEFLLLSVFRRAWRWAVSHFGRYPADAMMARPGVDMSSPSGFLTDSSFSFWQPPPPSFDVPIWDDCALSGAGVLPHVVLSGSAVVFAEDSGIAASPILESAFFDSFLPVLSFVRGFLASLFDFGLFLASWVESGRAPLSWWPPPSDSGGSPAPSHHPPAHPLLGSSPIWMSNLSCAQLIALQCGGAISFFSFPKGCFLGVLDIVPPSVAR